MGLNWLSFVNERGHFLGVCIVEGDSPEEAVASAWAHGCNPGGHVIGLPINDRTLKYADDDDMLNLLTLPRNKLLSKDDLEAAGISCETPPQEMLDVPKGNKRPRRAHPAKGGS